MWGVDNTLLSAALDGNVFDQVPAERLERDRHRAHRAGARATS